VLLPERRPSGFSGFEIGSCCQLGPSFGKLYWASILANWCTQKMLTTQGESNLNRHDGKQVHTLVKSIYL
jgi:hypothetical protein